LHRIHVSRRTGFILAGLAVVLVFIADALSPSGVIDWLLYALPLLIVSWQGERRLTFAVAGLCGVLIVAGLFLSPPLGFPMHFELVNRILGIAVLGAMTVLLSQRSEGRRALARQNALLETRVAERTAALAAESERLTTTLAALTESEARYRAIGELIPYGVWVCDPGGGTVYLSDSFLEMVGKTMDECRQFGWVDRLPPEDVERMLADWQACRLAGGLWDYSHRIRAKDGTWRHILSRGVPMRDAAGTVTAWVGINLDITERVRAEEELQHSREQLRVYAHKLVEEVENERRSIARELHDEAGQSLTALMIVLGMLEKEARRSAEQLVESIRQAKQITDDVAAGLHDLSRNLRPANLDRLGLVAALRQHIRAFQEQTGVEVSFTPVHFDDGYERLPGEIETTVYRIVQEALTNVARHARARQAAVILKRKGQRMVAIIEDDGTGFDVSEALDRGRLGLVGMRERAELMGGRFTISSTLGQGTTVFVEIPIGQASDEESQGED
jgi:two-component system sensor histidine kinase UhpB